MLTELTIKNFKSIRDLTLKPGRVTVLIGENGCGKSNILEALAVAAAAAANKLDHEFLASRGIRMTAPRFMRSAFAETTNEEPIHLGVQVDGETVGFDLVSEGEDGYVRLVGSTARPGLELVPGKSGHLPELVLRLPKGIDRQAGVEQIARQLLEALPQLQESPAQGQPKLSLNSFAEMLASHLLERLFTVVDDHALADFLVYSPENTSLRSFELEGQILPLGIKGEGLFKLLKSLSADAARMGELTENLRLIDWFDDFRVASDLAPFERTLQIKDRYLGASGGEALAYFDQRSANEGFLFLLFYFALFVSENTPAFFAIDNVDASLNPRLCTELMRRLSVLAAKHGKQVIVTTHNPAILDGLNLHDEDQRLYVVYRNSKGHTRARRVRPPKPLGGESPVKLSEAFLRGLLGGLPQNF